MGYTTLKQMIEWIADATSKNPSTNRPSLVKTANLVRQHMHLIYTEVQISLDKQACFKVQCFPVDCMDCNDTYYGITLPHDMQGIEAAWRSKAPISLYTKWREAVPGIGKQDDSCRLQIIDQGNIFPTELETNWSKPCRVMVKCDRIEDKGKIFTLKYLNQDGQPVEDRISLDVSYKASSNAVAQIQRPAGVVLPPTRSGSITLAREEDREIISIYSPFEPQIPAYKRVKVTGVCEGQCIFIKASAKYVPLFFDEDVVETDNELAVRELAKMIVYRDNPDPTAGYAALANISESRARKYLVGENVREKGNEIQQFYVGGRKVNRSNLSNRRRRW